MGIVSAAQLPLAQPEVDTKPCIHSGSYILLVRQTAEVANWLASDLSLLLQRPLQEYLINPPARKPLNSTSSQVPRFFLSPMRSRTPPSVVHFLCLVLVVSVVVNCQIARVSSPKHRLSTEQGCTMSLSQGKLPKLTD